MARMSSTDGYGRASGSTAGPSALTAGSRAAFFDLDRTLIPGSSLFLFARGLQARHVFGAREMLGFGLRQLVYRVGRTEMVGAMGKSKEAALEFARGRDRSQLRTLAKEICDERIVPRVYPDLAARIADHRRSGDLTFVTTAAPAELAETVAEALGMTGGLGTRAEVDEWGRYSGRITGPVLHGVSKAVAVAALAVESGIDLSASIAYSDSINDLPLLELVGEVVVVNPDRKLTKVAAARGWEVHKVRSGGRSPPASGGG